MGRVVEGVKPTQLKIGDLARLCGKTVRALHFYEEQGILRPVSRTEGGFRLYGPESVDRVALIDKLQALGMTLPDIGDLLRRFEHSETGFEAARTFQRTLQEKRRALDEEIQRLTSLRTELSETIEYLAHCVHECGRATGPGLCHNCRHAAEEGNRPSLMNGLYG